MKREENLFKMLGIFFLIAIVLLVCNMIGVRIYVSLVDNPIIFFASCIIDIILPIFAVMLFAKIIKKRNDYFTLVMTYISFVLILLVFSVFGPVFIDRSISYHIAFYAVEEGEVKIEDIEEEFSSEIFSKRILDAQAAGMIELQKDGSFRPTFKAKLVKNILMPIGKFTNSLETYDLMKEKVKAKEEVGIGK